MNLASAIKDSTGPNSGLRVGKVVSLVGTTCTVRVQGGLQVASYLDSYSPVADDVVALLSSDSVWLILGKIVGP